MTKRVPPAEADEVVGLWVLAQRLARLKGERLTRAARVVLAVHHALAAGETLAGLDAEAVKVLRRAAKKHPVSSVSKLKVNADAELIRWTEAAQKRLKSAADLENGLEDGWNAFVAGTARFLEHMQGAGREAGELAAKIAEMDVDVLTLTPTALARALLRAIGVPRARLKNFGAGLERKPASPNKARRP